MEDTRLSNIEKQMTDQGQLLQKVANALLGNLENSTMGLIEEQRNLKRQVDNLIKSDSAKAEIIEKQAIQIAELIDFKNRARNIVLAIATGIPLVFEVVKVVWEMVWAYITNHNGK